jgi:hypothetical protein
MLSAIAAAALGLDAVRLLPGSVSLAPPRRGLVPSPRVRLSPLCQLEDEEVAPFELDALDTSDSWDEQLVAQKKWEQEQAAKTYKSNHPAYLAEWGVDEEAHFGLGDAEYDDDPGGVENFKQKLMASELLKQVRSAAGGMPGAADSDLSNKRVLTSLESVISILIRLDGKLDAVMARLDKLEKLGSSGAPGDAPAPPKDAGEWDGQVVEGAYFDYDADDPLLD